MTVLEGVGPRRVLVIDDEIEIGEIVAAAAEEIGLPCTVTTRVADFRAALGQDVGVVVIDLVMPEIDGVELLRQLGEEKCRAGVVLISGFDRKVLRAAEALASSLGLNTLGRLEKPFRLHEVEALLSAIRDEPVLADAHERKVAPVSEAELRAAIEAHNFIVHYQPQIALASGRVCGLEALVRMQHPTRGLVYPDMFIPQLEQLGLIEELTVQVMRQAIPEFGHFPLEHGCTLSINVSACSLTDLSFPDRLQPFAIDSGVPLSSIVMEITETGLISELTKALDILTRLRMKQVGLSIDDFGMGYSSMAQLRRVPATELKIDRIFVKDMLSDPSAHAVVSQTISLGHELDLRIVAEGVETQQQADALRALGCDVAQGYLYARPLPAQVLLQWLARLA